MPLKSWQHRAVCPADDGGDIKFLWHFPRGTFEKRMSALEIAIFVMPHMPSILPLLGDHPRIQQHFGIMLNRLITWPQSALDELVTWIRPRIGTGPDDLIELNIKAVEPQPSGPIYSIPGV